MICPKCGQPSETTDLCCGACGYRFENTSKHIVNKQKNMKIIKFEIGLMAVLSSICGLFAFVCLIGAFTAVDSSTKQRSIGGSILFALFFIFFAAPAVFCGVKAFQKHKVINDNKKNISPIPNTVTAPISQPIYSQPIYTQPTFIPATPQEQQHLIDRIDSISTSGVYFEEVAAELLRHNGFINVHTTPPSSDYGVDVIATKDGKKYAIQCKCYSNAVGNKAVQEVNAGKSVYRCSKAVVMTNNCFTKNAQQLANSCNVELWERKQLQKFIANTDRDTIIRLIDLSV